MPIVLSKHPTKCQELTFIILIFQNCFTGKVTLKTEDLSQQLTLLSQCLDYKDTLPLLAFCKGADDIKLGLNVYMTIILP